MWAGLLAMENPKTNKMKNSLEALFGSKKRWRLIKMFLLNEEETFTVQDVAKKLKVDARRILSVLNQLVKAGFVVSRKKQGKKIFVTNRDFPFFVELKSLVIRSNVFPQCESLGKIKNLGNVKLGIVSGVFINNPKSKTDLLVVGDSISKAKMKHLLEDLEAEMGREINYSLMNMEEFRYRANMFDKFIMEVFESPHEVVVNKITSEINQLLGAKKVFQ